MFTVVETASEWLSGKLVSSMKTKELEDLHGWRSRTQDNSHMDKSLLLNLMMELPLFKLPLFLSTSAQPTTSRALIHWLLTRVTMFASILLVMYSTNQLSQEFSLQLILKKRKWQQRRQPSSLIFKSSKKFFQLTPNF